MASDLNPVATLINIAMLEVPARFNNMEYVHPSESLASDRSYLPLDVNLSGERKNGLAEDIWFYGQLILNETKRQLSFAYPEARVTTQMLDSQPNLKSFVGKDLTVLAWRWARSVRSPNPAFSHAKVPLISSFVLTERSGQGAYLKPVINGDSYRFEVAFGEIPEAARQGTKPPGKGAGFRCILSGAAIEGSYIKSEGQAGRLDSTMVAILAESSGGRVYLPATAEHEKVARAAKSNLRPSQKMLGKSADQLPLYGMHDYADIFTDRQLLMMSTFAENITKVHGCIQKQALAAGLSDDDRTFLQGGRGARAYADAISLYLSCALSRLATYNNTCCFWNIKGGSVTFIFARQAIAMCWDFIEINPLAKMSGNWEGAVDWVCDVVRNLPSRGTAAVWQGNATEATPTVPPVVISTDPPYYDNIGYADLSDFFYVWLRQSLKTSFPSLFATISTPKEDELVATKYRHGTKDKAEAFFLSGMTKAMERIRSLAHPAFPITIYYAFKQSETAADGTTSKGWATFLSAVISSGLSIVGTWPIRTERTSGVKAATNSLASSVVLVCKPRELNAPSISRREFVRQLNAVLPESLDQMTMGSGGGKSPVAPVDLSQAIIGPGMAVFSQYTSVLEADGSPMAVETALQLINRFLAEDDFDADTQFCLHWFEQYGWDTGRFGEADTLARAKGTSVDGVKHSGVLQASEGKVRLMKWGEYSNKWDPKSDQRLPIWEVLHQLIRVFNADGETGAAQVFSAVQSKAEAARQLAYRLYTLCERKNWAEDARAYNEVVTSWSGIEAAASKEPSLIQRELFDN
jgi:putative DNA methylase